MTKRERDALCRKITAIETKISKKRDELRKLLSEFEPLLDSISDGVEGVDASVSYLREARRNLEDATDTMSQYV